MLTLRESLHLVKNPLNLDESVREVFDTMLGVECRKLTDSPEPAGKDSASVTAVVGFGGILSGACVFHCNANTAIRIASRMTGMEFTTVDDVVKDGVGEICNMLAGTWKSKVPDLAANCGLSVPAVISGRDYHLHVQLPEFHIRNHYAFEDGSFVTSIVCDGLQ